MVAIRANLPLETYPKTIAYDKFTIFEYNGDPNGYFKALDKEAMTFFNSGGNILIGKGCKDHNIMISVAVIASFYEVVMKIDGDYWLLANNR